MEKSADTFSADGRGSIGLQSKFLVGLACIFVCFCIVATTLLYLHEKKMLEEEIYHKTELIMAAVESTRGYVREVLRPKMYEVLDDKTFILEAMSTSYISRVIMDRFQHKLPSFEYRRVAVNARNPDFEANGLEQEKINYFAAHPAENDWHGIVKFGSWYQYMRFRPVRFSASCLYCHGDPAEAPQMIINLYGEQRGFNRVPDVVSGVVSVGVPINVGLLPIIEVAWKVFCTAFVSVIFLYGIIWVFFNRLIINDLRGLLEIFRHNLRDEHGVQLYEQARAKDEFGELAASVQMVARHLQKTRQQLEDYAENLEKKVKNRTVALQHSEAVLREKVITRGQELRTLNTISELITRSVHLVDILPEVLQQAMKVVPASGAGIYLLDRKKAMLVLQCRENAEELAENIPFDPLVCLPFLDEKMLDFDGFIREASCSRLTSEPAVLVKNFNEPLCCRGQVLGIMTFVGDDLLEVDVQQQELLFSIGHQIGITIESLQNIVRLMNSKELLQSVFDGITDLVILLDPRYRIKMVNKAFLDQHDVKLEEILNRSLADLSMKKPCPLKGCKTPLSGLPGSPVVEQVHARDGSIYEVTFYPQFSEQGEVNNVICYTKNITEKKEVERRIQQTEKLVAVGQLAAGVAHEINNPLGVILCYTDLIKENNPRNEEIKADITVIERHTENCRRIVADLLDFSRSRGTGITKQPVSINGVIENVLSMVRQQFVKKQIALICTLDDTVPACPIDSRRLKQVLLNLIMNAGQAIVTNGTINIRTRAENSSIIIEVEDDGPGISKDIQDKIFDPFFSTKEPGEGTGLGLSVSYGIIQEHDGEIMVRSTPGHGTCFTLILPASSEHMSDE
jgi:PAS domain S-box-containing protein